MLARQSDKARERRVGLLIDEIRREGHDSDLREVIERKILPSDYELFQAVVKGRHHEHLIQKYDAKELRRYIRESLKYEYIPSTRGRQQFRILMGASAVHNTVERYWEKVINNWQRDINDDPFNQYSRKTKDLVEMIIPFGNTEPFGGKQKPRKDSWPSLVVEVVWSHALTQKKINHYILKSEGAIRTVVRIDLSKTHQKWEKIKRNWEAGGNNRGPVQIHEDGTADEVSIPCISLRDFVSERDEDIIKMNSKELRGLENLVLELDTQKFLEAIDVALEKQKEEDEKAAVEEEGDDDHNDM
ncbi:hypothetical protein F4825DRAFT_450076 [Nemania diffusa]|nr:hypothetical protein F4825DRAFT_450076 [Nemania diffusa]